MSKIQKQMHDICQPIIAEHYADFTNFNSEAMKKAYAAVSKTGFDARCRAIRSAYAGEDESMVGSVIERENFPAISDSAIPDELKDIYNHIIDACDIYRFADRCLEWVTREYGDYSEDYDSHASDYEEFDDYGYVDDIEDEYEDTESDSAAYDLFHEDVVYEVTSHAGDLGIRSETAAILRYAGYYMSRNDYYTAMCYVNLIFIPEYAEQILRADMRTKTLGELGNQYIEVSSVYAGYLAQFRLISALLQRMHNYEKTEFVTPSDF